MLQATVIDFTLSRATVHSSNTEREVLSGGFDDEAMFAGEGDYQYDCYRIMRRLVSDRWDRYCPITNVLVSGNILPIHLLCRLQRSALAMS